MIKLVNTTGEELIANQTIPLNVKYRSNNRIRFNPDTNEIYFKVAGYFDISASFIITSTNAQTVTIQMMADDVAIPEAKATETFAAAGTHTMVIPDIEKVLEEYNLPSTAKIKFIISAPATLVNANVKVFELK